ncbi:hypothetical protein CS542_10100 [Pedobacter sp. IW39]|nr:hypothetical protein CS542_10100 [Pedobacter sp. IW39]
MPDLSPDREFGKQDGEASVRKYYDVVGPIYVARIVLGRKVLLQKRKGRFSGDQVRAYGEVMSSHYNLRKM